MPKLGESNPLFNLIVLAEDPNLCWPMPCYRRKYRPTTLVCPRCKLRIKARSKDYCRSCLNEMKRGRYANESDADKMRRLAQGMTQDRVRRGTIVVQPCQCCGTTPTEAHHDDYSKPKEIMWLCKVHHVARHHEIGTWGHKRRKYVTRGRRGAAW